ncbi:GNAT family N-acetyltransferase [candidate division WOR-3 bacterium]|nr:GNAT family N-acetyltransferase [candidate division WOR-3 bacterium]
MRIINISPEYENLYFCCLEDWSQEMAEAGDHKKKWFDQMKEKGLRVKLAQDESGEIGGMIQYIPIENSMFSGEKLYAVLCIWVHGHKKGRGNFQKKGMGKSLLKAAEEDAKNLGAKGMTAWGIILPFFMKASWFKKQGYKTVDKNGLMRLLLKKFDDSAESPKFIKPIKKPEKGKEKVDVTIFKNGWCPAFNICHERILRAIKDFPDSVQITEYDGLEKRTVNEWGISEGIFIDGKELRTGPPTSYDKIRRKIENKVKKHRVK